MYKVKLMNKISSVGLDYFNEDYEYGETLEKFEKDAVITKLLSLLLERLDSGGKIISNDDFDKIYKPKVKIK